MKWINILLVLALAFLLFAPDNLDAKLPSFDTRPDAGPMSMYFSFAYLEDGGGDDAVDECQCGGDGDVGDGRIRVPCPCVKDGGRCNCPKEHGLDIVEPVQPEESINLDENGMPRDWTYAILFTNPEWCLPCVRLDRDLVSKLGTGKFDDWKKSSELGGYNHLIIVDEKHPLVDKYRAEIETTFVQNGRRFADVGVPSMLLIRNGEIKWKAVGAGAIPMTPEKFIEKFLSVK